LAGLAKYFIRNNAAIMYQKPAQPLVNTLLSFSRNIKNGTVKFFKLPKFNKHDKRNFWQSKKNSAGGIVQLIAVGDMGHTIPNEANNRLLGKPHRIGNQVKYLT